MVCDFKVRVRVVLFLGLYILFWMLMILRDLLVCNVFMSVMLFLFFILFEENWKCFKRGVFLIILVVSFNVFLFLVMLLWNWRVWSFLEEGRILWIVWVVFIDMLLFMKERVFNEFCEFKRVEKVLMFFLFKVLFDKFKDFSLLFLRVDEIVFMVDKVFVFCWLVMMLVRFMFMSLFFKVDRVWVVILVDLCLKF